MASIKRDRDHDDGDLENDTDSDQNMVRDRIKARIRSACLQLQSLPEQEWQRRIADIRRRWPDIVIEDDDATPGRRRRQQCMAIATALEMHELQQAMADTRLSKTSWFQTMDPRNVGSIVSPFLDSKSIASVAQVDRDTREFMADEVQRRRDAHYLQRMQKRVRQRRLVDRLMRELSMQQLAHIERALTLRDPVDGRVRSEIKLVHNYPHQPQRLAIQVCAPKHYHRNGWWNDTDTYVPWHQARQRITGFVRAGYQLTHPRNLRFCAWNSAGEARNAEINADLPVWSEAEQRIAFPHVQQPEHRGDAYDRSSNAPAPSSELEDDTVNDASRIRMPPIAQYQLTDESDILWEQQAHDKAKKVIREFKKAVDLATRKKFEAAFEQYQKIAQEDGLSSAAFNIGRMYEFGRGVQRSLATAFSWYMKAAQKKHGKAAYVVAIMYETGKGVEPNVNSAMQWYNVAYEAGIYKAEKRLLALHKRQRDEAWAEQQRRQEVEQAAALKLQQQQWQEQQTQLQQEQLLRQQQQQLRRQQEQAAHEAAMEKQRQEQAEYDLEYARRRQQLLDSGTSEDDVNDKLLWDMMGWNVTRSMNQ